MAIGILLLISTTSCASPSDPATTSITVFASSSLITSLTAIGKHFQTENPGSSVEFIFAGSSDLSAELADGAQADVFVSGDDRNMAAVTQAGLIGGNAVPFAANRLVIAAPPGNHQNLASFADLARPGLRLAVCGGTDACASATRRVEDQTGIRLHPQSADSTASDVVKDVTTGRADAGVVLRTDALNAGDNVSWFAFPESDDAVVTSWIGLLKESNQAQLAMKFIQDVTGATGRRIITNDGFAEPVKISAG
jgi:molybdate transport system substrate-binding protein